MCFTIVLVTIPALNRESRQWFDIVDRNGDGVISLMEWELFHPDIDSLSPSLRMFGRLDCDDSQYLSWSEYRDGRLKGVRCLPSSSLLSQESESGDSRLPHSLIAVTERQLESLWAGKGFLSDYGAFLESLPDVQQQNDNENAQYEVSCTGGEHTIRVNYSQREPGTYPSLTCLFISDVVQVYATLIIRVSVGSPEQPVTLIKPLYINSSEAKIHLISDRNLRIQRSDVRIENL